MKNVKKLAIIALIGWVLYICIIDLPVVKWKLMKNYTPTFTLKFNELGEYGKKEDLDGTGEEIIYKIPEGKYEVHFDRYYSKAKIGVIFVQQDEVHTESDGSLVHIVDQKYYFNPDTDFTNIIEVKKNQNVFITDKSVFDFIKIDD